MVEKTVYLITGANRGIGHALTGLLLQRPDTVVLATSREASKSAVASIESEISVHPSSKLFPIVLDEAASSYTSASLLATIASLAEQHPEMGLDHIDVAVANAGTSAGFKDVIATSAEDILYDFTVNAVGPAKLFQAVWPLLEKSPANRADKRKLVLISSSVGSIGGTDLEHFPCMSYGMSKAAANWWARKVSIDFKGKGLKVGIIQPGWVQTGMGQALADVVGLAQPPMTLKDSAEKVLTLIDALSPENSGKFLNHDGTEIPW